MRFRVLDEGAEALHECDQHHVRVELVGHSEPDGVAECLQLRRCLANVVPGRRPDPDLTPEILAVVNRVRDVILGEPVPLAGLGVVTALEPDPADLPDLARDLLNDLFVVDHLVLEPGLRRQVPEDVVTALSGDLSLRACRQLGEVDVVDLHVGVVLGAPVLRVRVVEPHVVGGNEVAPLDDLERVLVLLVDVLRHSGCRHLRQRAAVENQESAEPPADHLAARQALRDS